MFDKHLKIVEQIAVVFIFAVIIPTSISGFIINNINQQSMRYQLRESAVLIANMVSDEIDFFNKTVSSNLNQVAFSLKYFKSQSGKNAYLKEVTKSLPDCEKLEIASKDRLVKIHELNKKNRKATIPVKVNENEYLVATYKLDAIRDELFRSLADDKRQIYVLTNDGDLIAEHNYTDEAYKKTISLLPKKLRKNKPIVFGDVKNQPYVYVSKDEPKITIIVNTTEKVTKKAITIIFLAFEFNRMANEIHKSYIQLKKNNVELKQLNEFRSNLIDTVSHELRTPLTSIQGYTSRLMRQDIVIDEETRQKSLRIIKEQSERLKRLIEDLLTIPDIEGMRLRTKVEQVWIPEVLEEAKILIKNKDHKEIEFNISEDFPLVDADKDRLIQVFVNLLENAAKYANEGSKIVVDATTHEKVAKIYVKNDCNVIPPEKLNRLFEKFVRLDDNTTRTTRGTGLGLFIVKGLVEAMNGTIKLYSDENCGFCVELTLNLSNAVEVVQ